MEIGDLIDHLTILLPSGRYFGELLQWSLINLDGRLAQVLFFNVRLNLGFQIKQLTPCHSAIIWIWWFLTQQLTTSSLTMVIRIFLCLNNASLPPLSISFQLSHLQVVMKMINYGGGKISTLEQWVKWATLINCNITHGW